MTETTQYIACISNDFCYIWRECRILQQPLSALSAEKAVFDNEKLIVCFCGSPFFFVKVINFRSEKQDADAEIQPQHQKNHSGQASIHIGIIAEIIKINRKSKGEANPAKGGKNSAWQLEFQFLLFIRDKCVKTCKNNGQDR